MDGRSPIRFFQAMLAVAGVVVAALLTSFHYSAQANERLCSAAGGCGAVNDSTFSAIGPIPVAALGLGAYVAVLALLAWAWRGGRLASWVPLGVFTVGLIGVLFSAYLTYLELYVIHALCPWCLMSALLITLIWVLSLFDLRSVGAFARA